jgi:threonyl-tRNA synthetase
VYGITFPDKKQLTEWVNFQEEAKKRDHRRIGTQQELWTFDPVSAGSCFWLPRGAVIYNRLQVRENILAALIISRTLFEVNTESEDSRKLSRQTSSTPNFGRHPVIGNTTKTICSLSRSKRINGQ